MGFRTFPGDSRKKQLKHAKGCCPTHLETWECNCSWGCPVCWIAKKCTMCGASFNHPVARELANSK